LNYGQVRLGQGRENAKQFIAENPDLAKEIREKILAKRRPAPVAAGGNTKAPPEAPKAPPVPATDDEAKAKARLRPKFPPPKGRR